VNCEETSKLISQSLDLELNESEKTALREHLAGCPGCAEQERRLRALHAAMTARRPAALPAERVESAVAELRRRVARERPRQVEMRFRVVALAAMLMMAAGIIWLARDLVAARARAAGLSGQLAQALAKVPGAKTPPISAIMAPSEKVIAEQVQTFCATYDYLDGSLRWMVSDDGEVQLGLSGSPATKTGSAPRDALVLNFQYLERASGKGVRTLSKPQFVMISGEEVSVRLKGDADGEPIYRYRVRAERLVDGQVRAEVSFVNEACPSAEVDTTLNAKVQLVPGKPVLVGASGDEAHRWELYLWGASRPAVNSSAAAETGRL